VRIKSSEKWLENKTYLSQQLKSNCLSEYFVISQNTVNVHLAPTILV